MAILSISYDLYKEPGRAYDDLISTIKNFRSWCHAAESAWFVDTNLSPSEVYQKLSPHLHQHDKVIVTYASLSRGWCGQGMSKPITDWLHSLTYA
jgi:hypothetical protein